MHVGITQEMHFNDIVSINVAFNAMCLVLLWMPFAPGFHIILHRRVLWLLATTIETSILSFCTQLVMVKVPNRLRYYYFKSLSQDVNNDFNPLWFESFKI